MNAAGFSPYTRYDDDRPSRLILFPFTTYESFCDDEWIGREPEWFRIANILHWVVSHLSDGGDGRILLLQPDSIHFAENLAAYADRNRIITIEAPVDTAAVSRAIDLEVLQAQLEERSESSFDRILATGLFSKGAGGLEEYALLRACRHVLRTGCTLLATFPLQDDLGKPMTAANIQFIDAARRARFEQAEILGCQGIAGYLDGTFWDKLRSQGHAAFDAVFNALSPLTDSPATLWMSAEALYTGIKT